MLGEKGCPPTHPRRSVSVTEGIHATLPLLTMIHESSPYIEGPNSAKPHPPDPECNPDVEAPPDSIDVTLDSSDVFTHNASQFPVSHALAYLFLYLIVDSMLKGFVEQINNP